MSISTHYNLEELFCLVQQDDDVAFDRLYQATWERLFSIAKARLKDDTLAKQVIQDVYIDLWNKRKIKQIISIEKYLYQSVKYKVIDQFRKKNLKFEVVDDFVDQIADFEFADHKLIHKEYDALIRQWMDTLPRKRREIFLLRYVEGKTTREISERLNVSTKTVQNQILNATFTLKQLLQKIIYILAVFLCY